MQSSSTKTILIAGGSGLVGNRLSDLLESKSYRVIYLTRESDDTSPNAYEWHPEKKIIDENAIREADVIINLAGAPIAEKRWTFSRQRLIVNSRIFSTNLLSESLAKIPNKVSLVINASAIGIYGETKELIMHEDSPLANDFLGLTCQRWEAAAADFKKLGKRTVIFRIGLVLTDDGGMLKEIMKPLKFGFAFILGSGRQYQSWIHIDDLCKMIAKAIRDESLEGVYNAVAPGPLSHGNFMKLLVQILDGSQFLLRIPAIFIKLVFGEMSKVILTGTRVSSKKIESTGFTFKYPQADAALRNLLGK